MISDLIAAGYQHTATAVCIKRITQSLLHIDQCVCCTVMSKFSRFVQNMEVEASTVQCKTSKT